MSNRTQRLTHCRLWGVVGSAFVLVAIAIHGTGRADKTPPADPKNEFAIVVQPLIQKYCLGCHATKKKKGDLDLERFASVEHVRKDLKPWQALIEMLEAGEMPPKDQKQPTADERKRLIEWALTFVDAEARARAGDPGHVPLRRLSNAEYKATIRDLTGVNLQPARDFPAGGSAGQRLTT